MKYWREKQSKTLVTISKKLPCSVCFHSINPYFLTEHLIYTRQYARHQTIMINETQSSAQLPPDRTQTRKRQFQDFWLKYGRVNMFTHPPSQNYIKVTVKSFLRNHEHIKTKNEILVSRVYDSNGMLETRKRWTSGKTD